MKEKRTGKTLVSLALAAVMLCAAPGAARADGTAGPPESGAPAAGREAAAPEESALTREPGEDTDGAENAENTDTREIVSARFRAPSKTDYIQFEDADFSDGWWEVVYADGSAERRALEDCAVEGFDTSVPGAVEVTFRCGGESGTLRLTVHERYFHIGTAAGENSAISCAAAESLAGEEIRFTAGLVDGLPEKVLVFRELTVRVLDADGGAVEAARDRETGEWRFTMPASDVSILTSVRELPIDPETGFADVESGAYYYESLRWALEKGVVFGTEEHCFSPDAQVTRAEVATMLYRAKGSPEVAPAENPFTDVSEESDAYWPILWAFEKGYMQGGGDGLFHPDRVCTRAEFITTLWRAEGRWPMTEDGLGFTDVKWSDYFCRAVAWSVRYAVANGTSATTFTPGALCTRANAVTFLHRSETRRPYPDFLKRESGGWRCPVGEDYAVNNWVIRDGHYYHFNEDGFLDKDSVVAPSLVRIPGYYIHPMKASVYSTREERIEAMISTAYEYLGDRYVVYRSTAPFTKGVDCSGLVMQCLYAAGFDPYPATPEHHSYTEFDSRTLWNEVEMLHVSPEEMQRGDLIFYKKNQRATLINHIAIYLGNGYVIESWPYRVTDQYRVDGYPHTVICGVARPFE